MQILFPGKSLHLPCFSNTLALIAKLAWMGQHDVESRADESHGSGDASHGIS